MNFGRLKHRLALVTGGAGGIGLAAVRRLIAEGLRVIVMDRSEENLDRLQQEFTAKQFVPCLCDLADLPKVERLGQQLVEEHGPIQYLVNNAGVWPSAPVLELSTESWDFCMKVNVTSPLLLMQAVAPGMLEAGGGSIVNVSSRNAFRSSTKMAAYDASKAALVALTRTASGELGQHQIRVNAICPGVVNTEGDPAIREPLFYSAYTKLIPLARYGTSDEIASTITFLLSDESSFITGQTIIVDGGQIACQDNQRFMEIPYLQKHDPHVDKSPSALPYSILKGAARAGADSSNGLRQN